MPSDIMGKFDLDSYSMQILRLFEQRRYMSVAELQGAMHPCGPSIMENISFLRKCGYIEVDPDYCLNHDLSADSAISINAPLKITVLGKVVCENYDKVHRKYMFNEIRAWITLAIAVIALIISILTFFLK